MEVADSSSSELMLPASVSWLHQDPSTGDRRGCRKPQLDAVTLESFCFPSRNTFHAPCTTRKHFWTSNPPRRMEEVRGLDFCLFKLLLRNSEDPPLHDWHFTQHMRRAIAGFCWVMAVMDPLHKNNPRPARGPARPEYFIMYGDRICERNWRELCSGSLATQIHNGGPSGWARWAERADAQCGQFN